MDDYRDFDLLDDLTYFDRRKRIVKNYSDMDMVDKYNDEQFRERYRMKKSTFNELLQEISESLDKPTKRGNPVPPKVQLLVTLRYLATGTFQQVDGDLLGLPQTTVSDILARTTAAIARLRPKYIKFPSLSESIQVKSGFYKLVKKRNPAYKAFPNVIGCIDCTHIEVWAKGVTNRELFRNRKDQITINVQAICDSNLIFTDVVARWAGSVHDSRIFDNSQIKQFLSETNSTGWLLGDSGYPLLPYLMVPIQCPGSEGELSYNFIHCQVRNCIERAFGCIKKRFAVLAQPNRQSLENALNTTIACFVLHNIIMMKKTGEEEIEDTHSFNGFEEWCSDRGDSIGLQERDVAKRVRNQIVNRYFTS